MLEEWNIGQWWMKIPVADQKEQILTQRRKDAKKSGERIGRFSRSMRGSIFGGESGSAMIITLLVIATLVGLTVAFSEDTGLELQLAGYSRDHYRAYHAARSGVQLALEAIGRDEKKDMDSLREDWAKVSTESFPDGLPEDVTLSGGVFDESGKFNVNALLNEKGEIDPAKEQRLYRLFRVLGVDERKSAPILDWLDGDDIERMDGAENAYYGSLKEPYACSNGPFVTLGQLMMVKGVGETAAKDHLTVYSDGRININTASKEVLRCLDEEIDDSLAEAIAAFRHSEDFSSAEDLKKVPGMNEALLKRIKGGIDVKSSAFSIRFEGGFLETRSGIEAVLKRDEETERLVYWRVN